MTKSALPPLPLEVTFRQPVPSDLDLTWAWNQLPKVTKYLPSMPKPLSWAKHRAWWQEVWDRGKDADGAQNREDFMIDICHYVNDVRAGPGKRQYSDPQRRTVGRVHVVGLRTDSPEVGVLIGCTDVWGLGIGSQAIEYICAWLDERRQWARCHALIHPENGASVSLFEKCGFKSSRIAGRGGQEVYQRARLEWITYPNVKPSAETAEGHKHFQPLDHPGAGTFYAIQCECGRWFRHDGLVRRDPQSWVWEKVGNGT